MVADHTGVNKSATELVTKLKVTPEDNATSKALKAGGEKNVANLKALKGAAFDRAYVDNEVAYHQQVLDAVDKTLIPECQQRRAQGAAGQGASGVRRAPRTREADSGDAREGHVTMVAGTAGRIGASCLGLLLLSCSGSNPVPASPPQPPQTPHHRRSKACASSRTDLTVHAGDTIVWTNKDVFAHTATAAGKFDSRQIDANGGSWRYTPGAAGDIPYICTFTRR